MAACGCRRQKAHSPYPHVDVGPVPDRDTDSIQADVVNGLDCGRIDPISPVVCKFDVAIFTVASRVLVSHAIKLSRCTIAAHDVIPLVAHHPGLADEPS
jgi:hypothetical protein